MVRQFRTKIINALRRFDKNQGRKTMTQSLPKNDPDKESARLIEGASGIDEPKRCTLPGFLAQRQRAEVSFKATKEAGLNARAEITKGDYFQSLSLFPPSFFQPRFWSMPIAKMGNPRRSGRAPVGLTGGRYSILEDLRARGAEVIAVG